VSRHVSWTHESNERRTYRMCEDFADVLIAACIGEEDALIGVLLERSFQWLANKERNEVDKLGLIRFRASISSEHPELTSSKRSSAWSRLVYTTTFSFPFPFHPLGPAMFILPQLSSSTSSNAGLMLVRGRRASLASITRSISLRTVGSFVKDLDMCPANQEGVLVGNGKCVLGMNDMIGLVFGRWLMS
jgi:hypothetical protein